VHAVSVSLPLAGPVTRLAGDFLQGNLSWLPGEGVPQWRDEEGFASFLARRGTAHRGELAGVLAGYQDRLDAPGPAREGARALAREDTFAVVTGQGPGFLGGPGYVLYKALTAIRLARLLAERFPAYRFVPLFWNASEDHDAQEHRGVCLLHGGAFERAEFPLPDDGRPLHAVVPGRALTEWLDRFLAPLPGGERKDWLASCLAYREGESWSFWFSRILSRLLGRFGLVVIEPHEFGSLSVPLLRKGIESQAGLWSQVRDATLKIRSLGYHPAVELPGSEREPGSFFFYCHEGGRRRVDLTGRTPTELIEEMERHPGRFSPDVLLRPLVQDALLPTAVQVAGPTEMSYLLQGISMREVLGVPAVPLQLRLSATLLEPAAARAARKFGVSPEALLAEAWDPARWLGGHREEGLRQRLEDDRRSVEDTIRRWRSAAEGYDASQKRPFERGEERVRRELDRLAGRLADAQLRSSGFDPAELERLRQAVYPSGKPQDRVASPLPFLFRYGEGLIEYLLAMPDAVPERAVHQLVYL
jgi:bacillithiol biosynthesis cysteine-adding enzyme BshC